MAGAALSGLVLVALAEIPAMMASYLPSPSTAYKDAGNPKRVYWLKRHQIEGGAIALTVAAGVSLIAAQDFGFNAIWIFLASAVILGAFLWEYNYCIKKGQEEGNLY